MKITYRTALSALAAIGIAVTGIAANSADAYFKTVAVPARPATASDGVQTPVVTYANRAPDSGNNMGIAVLERNYGAVGRDRMWMFAAATGGTENVGPATWWCRASLYNGFWLVKQTSRVQGAKVTTLGTEAFTAFTPDASGPDKTYPRVAATLLRADCN